MPASNTPAQAAKPKRGAPKANPGAPRRPLHPYAVMAIAMLLPGMGQVANGTPNRGLFMALFMVVLAWITWRLTTAEHSFVGRYAGGFFIYAISVMDAYRWARYRWELFHRDSSTENPES